MNTGHWIGTIVAAMALALVLSIGGCGGEDTTTDGGRVEKPTEQSKTPLIPKQDVADWCREHVVPESICTRCDDSLVAAFKSKGDWCDEHDLPESQCFTCHPELEAKFRAMAPKTEGAD